MSAHARPQILSVLKQATDHQHSELERIVDIAERIRKRPAYAALLARFRAFYAPLEARLEGFDWASTGLDFAARRKVPLLDADLAALGAARPAADCDDIPFPTTLAEAFGVLYVLEGATLGGQIITKDLIAAGHPPESRRFFTGYGAETGAMWRAFQAAIAAHVTDEPRTGQAVLAATATFTSLAVWLRDSQPAMA
ncbi:MAG: biliverdin-producing heme oxygenase [Pseudomonadota bacterium]